MCAGVLLVPAGRLGLWADAESGGGTQSSGGENRVWGGLKKRKGGREGYGAGWCRCATGAQNRGARQASWKCAQTAGTETGEVNKGTYLQALTQ